MTPLVQDTIVALASPLAPGGRAILRLSGPNSVSVLAGLGSFEESLTPVRRLATSGKLSVQGVHSSIPADILVWAAPKSYTGQDLVELHMLGSPPLVEVVMAQVLRAEVRLAEPGEFTQRAFLAGKLDLTKAEAVAAVIDSGSRTELLTALRQLAGGLADPIRSLREDLLNLLADVEAGLDFTDEDIEFVSLEELLTRLAAGMAHLTNLRRQLEQRAISDEVFRIVLAGRPNAGKSSLFNALTGESALVSERPGTTRDYLSCRIEVGQVTLELIDTAGSREPASGIEADALELGREAIESANLVLLCVESGQPLSELESDSLRSTNPPFVLVSTKSDLAEPHPESIATSSFSGTGLVMLREELVRRASEGAPSALAPSVSRCSGHVDVALDHLRRAHMLALEGSPAELLALELHETLHHIGEMVGAVYTDDLLDRIFSRFCIGK